MSRTARFTKTNIITGVVILILAVTGSVFWMSRSPKQSQPTVASAVVQETPPQAEIRADYVSYQGKEGKNALELLKTVADAKTKSSSYGEFVESINGQDGGGKKYWTFYVNGNMAQVGAGAYVTKDADKIEWKLQ